MIRNFESAIIMSTIRPNRGRIDFRFKVRERLAAYAPLGRAPRESAKMSVPRVDVRLLAGRTAPSTSLFGRAPLRMSGRELSWAGQKTVGIGRLFEGVASLLKRVPENIGSVLFALQGGMAFLPPEGETTESGVSLMDTYPPLLRSVAEAKIYSLVSLGHSARMAGLLVEKELANARRLAMTIGRALDSIAYAMQFPEARIELARVADFFGLLDHEILGEFGYAFSKNDIANLSVAVIDAVSRGVFANELQRRAMEGVAVALIEFLGTRKALDLAPSELEEAMGIALIETERARPTIIERCLAMIERASSAGMLEKLAFLYHDIFLYSQKFAGDYYEVFRNACSAMNISVDEVAKSRQKFISTAETHILSEVRRRGKMTYAEFMQVALYDADYGFYSRNRDDRVVSSAVSEDGEFTTMPEKFTAFGRGVAFDVFDKWLTMGRPADFTVVEMGAGQGGLAKNFLETVDSMAKSSEDWLAFREACRYRIVEISPNLIGQQRESLAEYTGRIEWMNADASSAVASFSPESVTGVFLSNELPDAFPVHKVKMVNGRLLEVFVSQRDGELVEVLAETSTPELERYLNEYHREMTEGETAIINLKAIRWLQGMHRALKSGFIMTFDYGETRSSLGPSTLLLTGFRRYGRESADRMIAVCGSGKSKESWMDTKIALGDYKFNPLAQAGDSDITTDADFPAMSIAGRRLGMMESFKWQDRYFGGVAKRHPEFGDPEDGGFLNEVAGYLVQIFGKEAPLVRRNPIITRSDDLIDRGRVESVRDVMTFLELVEKENVLGAADIVRVLKERAKFEGRPLVGEAPTSIIRFGMSQDGGVNMAGASKYQLNAEEGNSLEDLFARLFQLVSADELPAAIRNEVGENTPLETGDMMFTELFDARFERNAMALALETSLSARFAVWLRERGGSVLRARQIRKTAEMSVDEIAVDMKDSEPFRTMIQLISLRDAMAARKREKGGGRMPELEEVLQFRDGEYDLGLQATMETINGLIEKGGIGDWSEIANEAFAEAFPELGMVGAIIAYSRGSIADDEDSVVIKDRLFDAFVKVIGRRLDAGR